MARTIVTTSHSPYLDGGCPRAGAPLGGRIANFQSALNDEARAKASPWGMPLCPPTILYAFDHQSIGYRGGFPGVHSMFGGSDFHWLRPITWGEQIHAVVKFADLIERPSKFAGRASGRSGDHILTHAGEPVCIKKGWGFRTERKAAAEKGKAKEASRSRSTPPYFR